MQTTNTFSWPIRVYYEDTDAGGVVYHSQYLNFMERARTEWLRHFGFEQTVLKDEFNTLFVVHALSVDYKKPAKLNDNLIVLSSVKHIKHCVIHFNQTIMRDDETLISAEVEVVSVSADYFKPSRMPLALKVAIEAL